jgi:hypothetical protein
MALPISQEGHPAAWLRPATDSPAGLAAWVLVHAGFSQWNYGDDPGQTLTKDDVLDDITLYWLTNTATSASRLYWENGGKSPLVAAAWKTTESKCQSPLRFCGRRVSSAGDVGSSSLPDPDLLPRGAQGRTLRRVGAAGTVRGRTARCLPNTGRRSELTMGPRVVGSALSRPGLALPARGRAFDVSPDVGDRSWSSTSGAAEIATHPECQRHNAATGGQQGPSDFRLDFAKSHFGPPRRAPCGTSTWCPTQKPPRPISASAPPVEARKAVDAAAPARAILRRTKQPSDRSRSRRVAQRHPVRVLLEPRPPAPDISAVAALSHDARYGALAPWVAGRHRVERRGRSCHCGRAQNVAPTKARTS